jgi:hypothetical protein
VSVERMLVIGLMDLGILVIGKNMKNNKKIYMEIEKNYYKNIFFHGPPPLSIFPTPSNQFLTGRCWGWAI